MRKFNYQSAKFNCGARKSKSAFGRLPLNFAICTLLICGVGESEAAKFCVVNEVASWSADANARTWTTTMKNGSVISGRYACASDLSQGPGCENNIPAGCIPTSTAIAFSSVNSVYSAKPVHSPTGDFCWCQILSPNPTGWIITGRFGVWPGGCNGTGGHFGSTYPNCAGLCANSGYRLLTGPINIGY